MVWWFGSAWREVTGNVIGRLVAKGALLLSIGGGCILPAAFLKQCRCGVGLAHRMPLSSGSSGDYRKLWRNCG